MKPKFLLPATAIIVIALSTFLLTHKSSTTVKGHTRVYMPAGEGEEEGEEHEKKKELWWNSMHRTAPGTDWKKLEAINRQNLIEQKKKLREMYGNSIIANESFANGQITGTWSERGSANQAGSSIAVDYVPETNTIYTVTSSGCLWKGRLDGTLWTVLNDDIIFGNDEVAAFRKKNGVVRILATENNVLKYSDNSGSSFIKCGGGLGDASKFYVYHVKRIFVCNDAAHTVYAEVYAYDYTNSQYEVVLFKSTNEGATFNKKTASLTTDENTVSAHKLYNDTALYTVSVSTGSVVTTKIFGNTVTTKTAGVPGIQGTCNLKGVNINGNVRLYMLINNVDIYLSTNQGTSWVKKGTLPFESWGRLDVSNINASRVFAGAVDAVRSYDAGASWSIVNEWYEYYGNVEGKLHADIMEIKHFKKSNGSAFAIINNHGGVTVSYDDLTTTHNLTLTGLYNDQYYDVLTNPIQTNQVYGGTQDQGWHLSTTANTAGILNMSQQISGDYGHLALTQNKHLWAEYPDGYMYYYNDPTVNSFSNYDLPGTFKPLYGWILPTASIPKQNAIYLAGGNITGGGGSYLVKLVALPNSPYTITASQFNYDFRAHANGGISAIEASGKDSTYIYVGNEDGSFFYSYNRGTAWSKAVFTGPGPWYLYGNSIYASRLTHNLVWYAGSGYSNAGVFQSTDGGKHFTAMGNGLPPTLVFDICANDTETLLFAGTEAGPYVYVRSDNQWYSLTGASTPLQSYTSVQYIPSQKLVRFSTFGRGIWDFKITSAPLSNLIADASVRELISVPAELLVYPNPVKDKMNISIKNYSGNAAITIYTADGKKVVQQSNQLIKGTDISLNTAALRPGIYYAGILINGKELRQKFIKQ